MLRKSFLLTCFLAFASCGERVVHKPSVVDCTILDPGPAPKPMFTICQPGKLCMSDHAAVDLAGWLERVHIMMEAIERCPVVTFKEV